MNIYYSCRARNVYIRQKNKRETGWQIQYNQRKNFVTSNRVNQKIIYPMDRQQNGIKLYRLRYLRILSGYKPDIRVDV